jgi:beta-glucosidase
MWFQNWFVAIHLITGAVTTASASPQTSYGSYHGKPTYKNSHASVEDRVADLLSRMTIEDKMAQLMQGDITNWMNATDNSFNASGLAASMEMKAGAFYVGYPVPQSWIAENVKKGQEYLLHKTKLGIPAFVQSEGIHGFLIGNATIFNSPIGYACSFNTALVRKMAGIIAREALALGVNQLFAPLADLARELRYGRVEECFGEDPHLAGEMAYSFVKGLQGGKVAAMVKHFVGVSKPEQGLNTGPVQGGERELRTTWMPPFKRAMMDAGALSTMIAYHSYDGIPAVMDHHTLTDVSTFSKLEIGETLISRVCHEANRCQILRDEWDYKYFAMSDAGATDRICNAFKLCTPSPNIDSRAVTMYALPAGCDVEMGGGSFNYRMIPDLVESGTLDEEIVDTAVSRILRAKFEMGLFEHPYMAVPASQRAKTIHTKEARAVARELDAESIVLLENHNKTLPLKKNANVAVIGPMAHGFMNYGDYGKSLNREDDDLNVC